MIYGFVINPSVTDDILDIVTYYKNINPELAIDFLDKIEIAKKYISDFPLAFQIKYKNYYSSHYYFNTYISRLMEESFFLLYRRNYRRSRNRYNCTFFSSHRSKVEKPN